jgi:hypothetical protein
VFPSAGREVVAKDALYLVQQGAQDWRALLGREVALGKTNNEVSLRAAPQRASARLFGLEDAANERDRATSPDSRQ